MAVASDLLKKLSELTDDQRLRFYESLALNLTVVNRVIWSDERASNEAKVGRLKNVNEIMHRVVQAVSTVRTNPAHWDDSIMVGEIRRWVSQDSAIAADVGWAIKSGLAQAHAADEKQKPAAPAANGR